MTPWIEAQWGRVAERERGREEADGEPASRGTRRAHVPEVVDLDAWTPSRLPSLRQPPPPFNPVP